MLDGGTPLDWRLDPLDVLRRWPSERGVFMLHSARLDPNWSRYTVMAQPVEAIRHKQGVTSFNKPASQLAKKVTLTHQPLADMRRVLDEDNARSLWLGTLGYDLGRSIEHLPDPPTDDRGWPDFHLERCDSWLVYDSLTEQWTSHGDTPELEPVDADAKQYHASSTTPDQTADDVKASIQAVKDYIAAGDVFQVNLAQRFSSTFSGSPRALYAALCSRSPAWYGAYGEITRFDNEEPRRTLASISPELLLDCDTNRQITTRPIKGTRPGDHDPADLAASEKDRAELAMIVDLMRNDLGRVCTYGSIRVSDSRTIETHPTVHHGVATITGQLHHSRDLVDLLRATLPGGSVTGAPKVRAMQIIDELEPARRGAYCGAIGMIRGHAARLSVAIRTLMIEQDTHLGVGRADIWAGGGIVADSDVNAEYQEMLDKARVMREVLGQASPVSSG